MEGIPIRRKGETAEAFPADPGMDCWAVGEYFTDCHDMWSAIIFVLWASLARCRECWSLPGFTVFVYKERTRNYEKNP